MGQYIANEERYDKGVIYRRLGRSGIMFPVISLGFWHNFGFSDDYDNSRSIVLTAFDHGVVHFDLANNYGPPYGSAECTFGKILNQDLLFHRNELFISTKAGYDMWPGPYGNWGSRKYLLTSLDDSLKRMKVDYVDLFYSHRYDPLTPIEETLQALVDAVRFGKALYVGISRWPLQATRVAIEYLRSHDTPLLAYQGRINMLDTALIDEGITSFCEQEGVGIVAFSPLAQGLLTDRYIDTIPAGSRMTKSKYLTKEALTPNVLARIRNLNKDALQQSKTLSTMAIEWVLNINGVTTALIGASSSDQLLKNLSGFLA